MGRRVESPNLTYYSPETLLLTPSAVKSIMALVVLMQRVGEFMVRSAVVCEGVMPEVRDVGDDVQESKSNNGGIEGELESQGGSTRKESTL